MALVDQLGYQGRQIAWRYQERAVDAATVAPTADTDGVLTHPHRKACYIAQRINTGAPNSLVYQGLVWVMRGGIWHTVMEFDHWCAWEPTSVSVGGDVPLEFPERVYVQITSCTASNAELDLLVGVLIGEADE